MRMEGRRGRGQSRDLLVVELDWYFTDFDVSSPLAPFYDLRQNHLLSRLPCLKFSACIVVYGRSRFLGKSHSSIRQFFLNIEVP